MLFKIFLVILRSEKSLSVLLPGFERVQRQKVYTDITAVALRTVRHNERSSILTAWSPRLGRLSLVMGAGNSAESRRRRALTMPLCLFEAVVSVRNGTELLRPRDMRAWSSPGFHTDVTSHPVRSSVAMFVAEVLSVVTREGDGDPALWQLVVETTHCIASGNAAALANLPQAFLFRLISILGIEPDVHDYAKGKYFDMTEGIFRNTRPAGQYFLEPDEAAFAVRAAKAFRRYSHLGSVRIPRPLKRHMLERFITYFALHHFPLDRLRSLGVLQSIFE